VQYYAYRAAIPVSALEDLAHRTRANAKSIAFRRAAVSSVAESTSCDAYDVMPEVLIWYPLSSAAESCKNVVAGGVQPWLHCLRLSELLVQGSPSSSLF
jgi:hypothetical protein